MAGFTAIFSKHTITQDFSFRDKSAIENPSDFSLKHISGNQIRIEQFTITKFLAEKICQEDENFIIVTDGVLLNLNQLQQKYQVDDVFSLLKTLYTSKGKTFVNELRGDYSGLIFDKSTNTCFVFTNHTGSKRIFYLLHGDYFICSSDLAEISHLMDEFGIDKTLNEHAAYFLLTNGFMLEEHTLVAQVKRLMPGNFLIFENNKLEIANYFHLKNIHKTTDSKKQIIDNIDALFGNAVRLQFEKDKAYGYGHAATLSGGLDSRMTILVAHKIGYTNQLNFTFSQEGYLDEKIARKIARDYGHEFIFKSLGSGDYLKEIDPTVRLNDGLVIYYGGVHVLDAIRRIDLKNYGLVHTGLIGDAVIGSFLSAPQTVKPGITDGMYSTVLADAIKAKLTEITGQYENEELYKFYSRAFLGAMNGNYIFDQVSHAVSPFLDVDFLSYCYSIPDELKYKQQIYIEWIKVKHRDFARYPWEKTGVSPLKSNNILKYTDLRYYQRMSLKFFDKLSGKLKSGMNPFDFWLTENKTLATYLEQYFQQHIILLEYNSTLQEDCIRLFKTGNAGEKFQVLTLLSALKLHQIKA